MRSVLISIKPEWTAKILNGEKTVEIRKTAPKEWVDYLKGKTKDKPEPMIVYIYCTKGDYIGRISKKYVGKVVARFTLNEVEEIICRPICGEWESYTKTLGYSEISKASCLGNSEIVRYLKGNNGYAWHISDLEILDEQKEISEFMKTLDNFDGIDCWRCSKRHNCSFNKDKKCEKLKLTRAPQSWCYVEEP